MAGKFCNGNYITCKIRIRTFCTCVVKYKFVYHCNTRSKMEKLEAKQYISSVKQPSLTYKEATVAVAMQI